MGIVKIIYIEPNGERRTEELHYSTHAEAMREGYKKITELNATQQNYKITIMGC